LVQRAGVRPGGSGAATIASSSVAITRVIGRVGGCFWLLTLALDLDLDS